MKLAKSVSGLLLLLLTLFLANLQVRAQPAEMNQATATTAMTTAITASTTITLAPISYSTTRGLDGGQSVLNLTQQDQTILQNDWDRYVEFNTPNPASYSGERVYKLADEVDLQTITSLQVQANYLGATADLQTWTWSIHNWNTGQWVDLGNNSGAISWQWTLLTFNLADSPAQYVNPTTRAIHLRVESNNDFDDMDLDYEAITITYGNSAPTTQNQKLLIPAYFDADAEPGIGYWKQLQQAAPTVGMTIVNPNSGVGASRNPLYAAMISATQAKGIFVVGYVFTSYSARPLAEIKAEIDRYYEWYGVDGIFLDEVYSADCNQRSYYQELYTYIKSKGGSAKVIINPGTNFPECMMTVNDIAINIEESYANYLHWQPSGWETNYPAERFAHLIHGAAQADLANAIALSKARHAGWIYITPDELPNPWDTLPPSDYWQTELNLAHQTSGSQLSEIDVIPGDSINVSGGNPSSTVCCISGYVYRNGVPIADAAVVINDQQGGTLLLKTEIKGAKIPHPYYEALLPNARVDIKVNDVITITASFANQVRTLTYRVQPGSQQVDLVLPGDASFTGPIATVNQHLPINPVETDQIITLRGVGQDSDATPAISAYRWESDRQGPLGSTAELTLNAGQLLTGTHQISFTVVDDEGNQSIPARFTLEIAPPRVAWTFLLYLAGDYNDVGKLKSYFWASIAELKTLAPAVNSNFAIWVDGPAGNDSYYTLSPAGERNFDLMPMGEKAMDTPEALAEFVKWGQQKFPNTHYYLAIADHGNAVYGIAWDYTSGKNDDKIGNNSAFLSAKEIRTALQDPAIQRLDILHLDACSMSTIEVAFELKDVTDFLIASEYLGWSHFAYADYAKGIVQSEDPKALALHIADIYATKTESWRYPYTISVLNLHAMNRTNEALSDLAGELKGLVKSTEVPVALINETRAKSQIFTSDENYQNDPQKDFYVDLADWTQLISDTIPNATIKTKANTLLHVVKNSLVIFNRAKSAQFHKESMEWVNLDHALGVAIFYPPSANLEIFNQYIRDDENLFSFTKFSAWPSFLQAPLTQLSGPDIQEALPVPLESLAIPSPTPQQLYLPIVTR